MAVFPLAFMVFMWFTVRTLGISVATRIPKDAVGFGLVRDGSGALMGTYETHSVRFMEDLERGLVVRRWWTLVLPAPLPFHGYLILPRALTVGSPNTRSNLTGDSSFDAAFNVIATRAAAPAYLDRATRDLLVGLLDRFDRVLIDGPRVQLGSPALSVGAGLEALARLAERLSVAVVPSLSRIVLARDEPATLRVWALQSLQQTAGAKARDAASVLVDDPDSDPAVRVRAAIFLERPAALRSIATDSAVHAATAREAIDALASFPDPENRAVVLHALSRGIDQVMAAAFTLAGPSRMDATTLLQSAARVTSEPSFQALCVALRELADPVATTFLLDHLDKPHVPATLECIFRALGACASRDALPRLLEQVESLPLSDVRRECRRAIASIRTRLAETGEPGRLSVAALDSGELTFAMDAGALSPADDENGSIAEH